TQPRAPLCLKRRNSRLYPCHWQTTATDVAFAAAGTALSPGGKVAATGASVAAARALRPAVAGTLAPGERNAPPPFIVRDLAWAPACRAHAPIRPLMRVGRQTVTGAVMNPHPSSPRRTRAFVIL